MERKDAIILVCPICDDQLQIKIPDGWLCQCHEMIPFGMEKDDNENCSSCPVIVSENEKLLPLLTFLYDMTAENGHVQSDRKEAIMTSVRTYTGLQY